MKIKGFLLYKFYYGDECVYLGRTKQPLQDRVRGHLFKKPMHRAISAHLVTRIEYATFESEADMFLYEVYFINLLKPPLNVDDKALDLLTVVLPNVEFVPYDCKHWNKWLEQLNHKDVQLKQEKTLYEAAQHAERMMRHFRKTHRLMDDYYDECIIKIHRANTTEEINEVLRGIPDEDHS